MTSEDILSEARAVFRSVWTTRDGRQVPDVEDVKLGNDAVKIDATVLYADMKDSTGLVDLYKPEFAAEIYKTFLLSACRILRNEGGEITAFDGDRVMAVFVGDYKNSSAAKSALHIKFIVDELNKVIVDCYPKTSYRIGYCIGIDTSELFVARTGIRNANDLVWVGRAGNHAAKLSALREDGYGVYITEDVYKKLSDASKYGGEPKRNMWEQRTWRAKNDALIYRSNWWWRF